MAKIEEGREFRSVLELVQNGKVAEGNPKPGAYEIRMVKGMTFHGDAKKAIKELVKSYPKCKFKWAKEAPKEDTGE